ncbi:MAG TPA: hypothetical protein VIU62_05215 [Chloroflexota bacterium]|jgi:hypothetical protein
MPRGKVQPQIAQFAQSILDAVNLAITQRLNRAGIADTQISAGSLSGSAGAGFSVDASQVSGASGSSGGGIPGSSPEPANTVLAGPISGAAADPTFRALAGADLAGILTSKGDLLTVATAPSRLPVGTDGTLLAADSSQPAGLKWISPAAVASGPLSDDAAIGLTDDGGASLFDDSSPGGGGGSGTVTSVGLVLPGDFAVTGSPVTGSGTLTAARTTQSPNTVLAGPASGIAAAPAYRALVSADLPAISVASAATLNLNGALLAIVTGTVTSTDLSNPPAAGQPVTLTFQSAGMNITNGNHWHLLANVVSVANGELWGSSDGLGNFVETGRSPGMTAGGVDGPRAKVHEQFFQATQNVTTTLGATSYLSLAAGYSLTVACLAGDRVVLSALGQLGSVGTAIVQCGWVVDKDSGTKLSGGGQTSVSLNIGGTTQALIFGALDYIDDNVAAGNHVYALQGVIAGNPGGQTIYLGDGSEVVFKVEVWR